MTEAGAFARDNRRGRRPRTLFLERVRTSVRDGSLIKLTLGKYRGSDSTLRNVFVRPVQLRSGPRLQFVWRHTTRDITRNFPPDEAERLIGELLDGGFRDAHLFTPAGTTRLETDEVGAGRLKQSTTATPHRPVSVAHDREKMRAIDPQSRWLQALGVTNESGQPRQGQTAKFRQIQRYAELLPPLLDEAFPEEPPFLPGDRGISPVAAAHGTPRVVRRLRVADMGCGKGLLTFALAALLRDRAQVTGIEVRPDLVERSSAVARECGMQGTLEFRRGKIADSELQALDVLIALHACDTATDDALAKGIAAGARLLLVAPCCHKELRPGLHAPAVLAPVLRHGILKERQAEFVTDAMRTLLLEWAGYRTRVFEFISTEHTAKNLMIAAVLDRSATRPSSAAAVRALAAEYGIRKQHLATRLEFDLTEDGARGDEPE